MTAPSPAQQSLPVTLDWYRQGANWLVGLASGVVAANLALVDKITGAAFWVEVVDGIALFLLLLVVVAGVFFYWWLTTYGNKREKKSSLEEELARETDPAQKASLEKKIQEAQQRMALAQTAFANWYKVLLWCFPLGLAALAIVPSPFSSRVLRPRQLKSGQSPPCPAAWHDAGCSSHMSCS